MTDLEMTRLCAMGLHEYFANGERLMKGSLAGGTLSIYDPLHDDAQAMALVKKLRISIQVWEGGWVAWAYDSPAADSPIRIQRTGDLNRAIVECVARMQKAKT